MTKINEELNNKTKKELEQENNTNCNQHEQYMERFYDPAFTAYDFLSLFSAVCITENLHCFNLIEMT